MYFISLVVTVILKSTGNTKSLENVKSDVMRKI
jgi:hypothetical protein